MDQADGQIDIIRDLIQRVPLEFINDYFGMVPEDENIFVDAILGAARYLFADYGDDPNNREVGLKSGKIINKVIEGSMAYWKANPVGADNVITRYFKLQKDGVPGTDDNAIRSNVFGTIMGSLPAGAITASNGFNFLMDRPKDMEGLKQAAIEDKDQRILRYIYEANRFEPMTPGWFRHASEDYIVAKGTSRATKISKGTTVIALSQSAMMDPKMIDDPDEIKLDRPEYNYFIYGYGMHECMGKYIADPTMYLTLKPLLKKKNLRRAPGEAGEIKKLYGFPNNMTVLFDN